MADSAAYSYNMDWEGVFDSLESSASVYNNETTISINKAYAGQGTSFYMSTLSDADFIGFSFIVPDLNHLSAPSPHSFLITFDKELGNGVIQFEERSWDLSSCVKFFCEFDGEGKKSLTWFWFACGTSRDEHASVAVADQN